MDRPLREDKVQRSQVVFFSNLPREDEKKKELLTIAGRFGIVEKHLFLSDQVGSSAAPYNVKLISHHSVLEFQISNYVSQSDVVTMQEFNISLQPLSWKSHFIFSTPGKHIFI